MCTFLKAHWEVTVYAQGGVECLRNILVCFINWTIDTFMGGWMRFDFCGFIYLGPGGYLIFLTRFRMYLGARILEAGGYWMICLYDQGEK